MPVRVRFPFATEGGCMAQPISIHWLRRVCFSLALLMLAGLAGPVAHADESRQIRSGDFIVEIDVRAQTNLIHHLDCLSGQATCTKELFEELWRKRLGLDDGDKAALEAWRKLREQAQIDSGSDLVETVSSPVPLTAGSGSTWTKIRHAGYLAPSRDTLKKAWRPLVSDESLRAHLEILERFRPRFLSWWRDSQRSAKMLIPQIEAAMLKARGPELLRQASRFLGAELGERRVFVHLIVQPVSQSRRSRAEIVDGHMVVEVKPGEEATDRVPVIIHELAHHVWARVPVSRKAMVATEMLRAGRDGVAAWNLFDEVQATVIGNMLASRNAVAAARYKAMLDRPMAFYADEAIDAGARASFGLFEAALAGDGVMDGAFVQAFVAALRRDLRAMFDTPMLLLRNVAVNIDEPASGWIDGLAMGVRAWGLWTYAPLGDEGFTQALERFPAMSAAVFVREDQLEKLVPVTRVLGASVEALRGALGTSRGVAVIADRTPYAIAVIFLVRDPAVMDKLTAAVASCPLKSGVCARVP